jgi:hypothetical protein
VTGIINGFGSVMAALGLLLVGPLQEQAGWRCVWHMLALSSGVRSAPFFISSFFLSPPPIAHLLKRF